MSFQDHFADSQIDKADYSWTRLVAGPAAEIAKDLANHIVRERCPSHYYEAWLEAVEHGSKIFGPVRTGFEHLISEVLQLPGESNSPPPEHVQGYVGEALWHLLSVDHDHRIPVEQVEWGWNATDPGGDGLIIHRSEDGLSFRLWEIKKTVVEGGVSGTVGAAVRQMKNRGPSYLARWMKVGQEKTQGDVREFYGYLLDHWQEASVVASVGVAVASSNYPPPDPCFHQLPADFPDLCDPSRLRGLLAQLEDFEDFCIAVRERVWTAL